ncbi:DUF4974 domain-containing protein [Chitinophaga agrisoli]|uniref:DUF4974 domain-containing protein n=1 Tax=Chitinophaga agrisoli TaxID=2607653 RepID=A0A5B2VQR0_9BACT|nr:FecR domain-containing protein [Chitinophaga agrisoli]KAA2241375.1 DUF4974 domain-containing protein [Chitinophaga agrisoli]
MRSGKADRLTYLYTQYINGLCTETELQEFFELVSEPGMQETLQELADKHLENIRPGTLQSAIDWDYMYNRIVQPAPAQNPGVVKRLFSRWYRIAAAAAILVVISSTVLLVFYRQPNDKITGNNSRYKNDIPPGGSKAVLTLANGAALPLYNSNYSQAQTEYIHMFKLDSGELAYSAKTRAAGYHTLSTPRGGQFRLVLPDGSRIWLNAASSITYPLAFTGSERKVAVSGEVYMEIAKDAARPFKVTVNGIEITVLGTRFNINAYQDEDIMRTTLLDGRIRVRRGTDSWVLQPGQQMQLRQDNDFQLAMDIDTAAVIAWKDGQFSFNDDDISAIMRQVQRWYDAEVVYENRAPQHFVGTIPRDVPVSKLLTMLELTGRLRFKIEGRKITVTQPLN